MHYRIDFMPDSFADYEHKLIISTEIPSSFVVPVLARRENPSFAFPSVLDCGFVWAGRSIIKQWSFTNVGGPGRFILVVVFS